MIKKTTVYFIFAYLLNFFWESWHAVYLYWGHLEKSFSVFTIKEYLGLISYVSSVDALILLGVLILGAFIWKNFFWFQKLNGIKISYALIATILVAVFIEVKGVYILKQWSYSDLMPTVFGLGLSPLLQLPLTALASLFLIKNKN